MLWACGRFTLCWLLAIYVYLWLDIFWNIVLFGDHFTDDFLFAIQIPWKIQLAVIQLLAAKSQQAFAHTTTAQLSWHVQNFVPTLYKNYCESNTKFPSNLNGDRIMDGFRILVWKLGLHRHLHVYVLVDVPTLICLHACKVSKY